MLTFNELKELWHRQDVSFKYQFTKFYLELNACGHYLCNKSNPKMFIASVGYAPGVHIVCRCCIDHKEHRIKFKELSVKEIFVLKLLI